MDSQTGRIVVGYDGSEPAGTALDWAADQAERLRLPLTVVSVADYGWMQPGIYTPPAWPELFQEEAAQVAAKGGNRARKTATSIDVSTEAEVGHAADVLVGASRTAECLVVGTRGHTEVSGALLGSVSFAVSLHTHSPVVVVRGDGRAPGPDRPVLVGVDDSDGARAALRYAADRAAESGASLIVATSYHPVSALVWAESGYFRPETEHMADLDAMARKVAGDVTAAAARSAKEHHPALDVRQLVIAGSPARELVRAADDCALLVIGTRGRGGFTGLLLGSVSRSAIHSAPCPVAIVPAGR